MAGLHHPVEAELLHLEAVHGSMEHLPGETIRYMHNHYIVLYIKLLSLKD